MNTTAIRQHLHNYLEIADDKKVKAFYTMMEDDIKESGIEYTSALKKELDSQYESYKTGKTRMVTSGESKKRINKILKDHKKK